MPKSHVISLYYLPMAVIEGENRCEMKVIRMNQKIDYAYTTTLEKTQVHI
jgi:hypothetical protein